MQTRPYDGKDGRKVWLSRDERDALLGEIPDGQPRRRIALQLALNGLRTDEIVDVQPRDLRSIGEYDLLTVRDGKTGKREVPISDDTAQRIRFLGLNQREDVIDVGKRTIRNWIGTARGGLDGDGWGHVGMHDLRRTWATDTYYSLAFEGVPIAEQLVMSWGGWKQTTTGRETFRENYLGPVPDHITERSLGLLEA